MKKLLVIVALLAIGIVQAATVHWTSGSAWGVGGDTDWDKTVNWIYNDWATHAVPAASDDVYIDRYTAGNVGLLTTFDPSLSSATPTLGNVFFSAQPAGPEINLSLINGASLNAGNLQLGAGANATNTMYMSGNASATAGGLWVGVVATACSEIQMIDTSTLTVNSGLFFAGDSQILMDDSATVSLPTILVTDGWENTVINAIVAQKTIARVDDGGTGWTEYTVIPEPTTFGLLAVLGLAFLRRK